MEEQLRVRTKVRRESLTSRGQLVDRQWMPGAQHGGESTCTKGMWGNEVGERGE